MSWFKPKVSQEDFDYLVKMAQTQKAEIIRLEGKIQALDTALSHIRIKVAELENSNNHLGSPIKCADYKGNEVMYEVITHYCIEGLTTRVNSRLAKGYKLQGGVRLIENKKLTGVLGNILYAQAMIKEME